MDTDDVIDTLNDLIEVSKDGEYGFRSCAEHAKNGELKAWLEQRAEACAAGAAELQTQVISLGGEPEDSGTALGALHRGWVATKTALTTKDDKAILEEAERGEDSAKAKYIKALKEDLPDEVRAVVDRHYQGVLANHDAVKAMRDALRAATSTD